MKTLADAYNKIAEGFAEAALALDAAEASPDAPGAPSFEELPADTAWVTEPDYDQPVLTKNVGSASVCPSHNIEYRDGRYGKYCPSTAEDSKWSNDKGYCTITPKNAAAWLRQKAAR